MPTTRPTSPDADFSERLTEEIAGWRRAELISAAQARAIMSRYGLEWVESEESRRRGRLSNVVMTLGAVLTGVGVIIFVASNWDQIGRLARMLLVLAALATAYGSAIWSDRRGQSLVSAALVFLGTLIFGANIFVVAQTYHVISGSPMLLAFWAAGALATAYTSGSRPSAYLGVLCLLLWYVFQIGEWDTFSRGPGAQALSTANFLLLGLLAFNLGAIHRAYPALRRFAGAYANIGIVVMFGGLLVFSFAEVWRSLGESASSHPAETFLPVIVAYALFGLATLFTLGLLVMRLGATRRALTLALGILVIGLSSLLVTVHPFDSPTAYALFFNLTLLAAVLWAVVLGIWMRHESLINLALVFFALQVLARYFDFFFALFDRSLVFIGAGVLLLVGGWLIERSRRMLIGRMDSEVAGSDV